MADNAVHIGEDSAEGVAYKLYKDIAYYQGDKVKDPKWVLDMYSECLMAVRQPADRAPNYQ
jgi:hypothetical protein